MIQFDETQKKALICRGCAGRTLGYDKHCCQENKFINVLKQHYVDGINIAQLREMLDLTQGCENFCEEHGYLYEFVLTRIDQIQTQQVQFEDQILCCKKCLTDEKNLKDYYIQLLNDDYFTFQQEDQHLQNQQQQEIQQNEYLKQKKRFEETMNDAFKKMKEALKYTQIQEGKTKTKLDIKIEEASKRKEDIKKYNQFQQYQQSILQGNEKDNEKVQNLNKLKNALEQRIIAISNLGDGYHDYLHDEFLEGESVRQKIIGDDSLTKGFSINDCYKLFDNIQYI